MVAVLALAVGLFAGCGSEVKDKNEQGQTVVTVGGWPAKEGNSLNNWNRRKDLFMQNNADVEIVPDNWAFDLKTFYAKAAGGQFPTVYGAHFTKASAIIDSGYSADLTKVLSKRGYDGTFNKQVIALLSEGDRIYGFPGSCYILGLTFNVDMLKAVGLMEEDGTPKQPKDWYEMAEFAQKIKAATGKAGMVFPTAGNNGGWIFNPVAWSFGVDFMKQNEDQTWTATFNTPEAVEALQFIKDLKWKYDVLPANTLVDGEEMYKTFATGNAGMLIAAGDMPGRLVKYGMTPDQVGIMALPAGPKKHVTLLGGSIQALAPNATEAQIEAGIRWIESSTSYKLSEELKTNLEEGYKTQLKNG